MREEEKMHVQKLSDRVWTEIEKTEISAATIKNIGEAVDILKDLSEIEKNCATIEAMQDYAEGEYNGWLPEMPGAARAGKDDKDRMKRYLESRMANAATDEEKDIIRDCMIKIM